jgi:hypothetical protein
MLKSMLASDVHYGGLGRQKDLFMTALFIK